MEILGKGTVLFFKDKDRDYNGNRNAHTLYTSINAVLSCFLCPVRPVLKVVAVTEIQKCTFGNQSVFLDAVISCLAAGGATTIPLLRDSSSSLTYFMQTQTLVLVFYDEM